MDPMAPKRARYSLDITRHNGINASFNHRFS